MLKGLGYFSLVILLALIYRNQGFFAWFAGFWSRQLGVLDAADATDPGAEARPAIWPPGFRGTRLDPMYVTTRAGTREPRRDI